MTKNDANVIAQNAAEQHATLFLSNPANLQSPRDTVKTYATEYAALNVAKGRHAETMQYAFVTVFMSRWSAAHNALPDVMAARRVERLLDYCHGQVARGTDVVATFATKLTEDRWDAAFNAFEWADSAAEAAASVKVARRVLAWYETAKDVDRVLDEVRSAVWTAARSPKHSTSQLSNLMAQNELAAYAAVLDACK